MSQPVLIAVAWPYASAHIHVGNITGAYLPADILARYHRLRGRDVLMVSGSDSHGTPVTVRADADGFGPEEVYKRFHSEFIELFQKLGLTYDIYTSTHTSNHFDVAKKLFLVLEREWLSVHGYLQAVVFHRTGTLPARPLCGRHLLLLRESRRTQRSMRQLRTPIGSRKIDRSHNKD